MTIVVKHRHTPHQYVVVPGGKYWLRNVPARQALEQRERVEDRWGLDDAEMESYGPIIGPLPDDSVDVFGIPTGKQPITPTWYAYGSPSSTLHRHNDGTLETYHNGRPGPSQWSARFGTREWFTPPFRVEFGLEVLKLDPEPFHYDIYFVTHVMHDMRATPDVRGNCENIVIGWGGPTSNKYPIACSAELPDPSNPDKTVYGHRTGFIKRERATSHLNIVGVGPRPVVVDVKSHDEYEVRWNTVLVAYVKEKLPSTMLGGQVGFGLRLDGVHCRLHDLKVST